MFHPQYTFTSHAPPAELLARLQTRVEPRRAFRFLNFNSLPFEGEIRGNQFSIRRIINYRNSFRPHIKGRIDASGNASVVKVSMRIGSALWVFMGVMLGVSLLTALVFIILAAVTQKPEFLIGVTFFPIMLIVTLAFVGAFWYEVARAREILRRIFR